MAFNLVQKIIQLVSLFIASGEEENLYIMKKIVYQNKILPAVIPYYYMILQKKVIFQKIELNVLNLLRFESHRVFYFIVSTQTHAFLKIAIKVEFRGIEDPVPKIKV